LWLTSTVTNAVKDRFRIMAAAVGRQSSMVGDELTGLSSIARIHPEPPRLVLGSHAAGVSILVAGPDGRVSGCGQAE